MNLTPPSIVSIVASCREEIDVKANLPFEKICLFNNDFFSQRIEEAPNVLIIQLKRFRYFIS